MIFLTKPTFSQDSIRKPDKKGKVKLLIKVDKDGKSRTLDTTFSIDGPIDEASLEDLMKDYNDNMRDFADQMKEMEINIRETGVPDSASMDSLYKMVKKFRITARDGKGPGCCHGKDHSFRFDYDFDIPDIPEPPAPPAPPHIWGFGRGFDDEDLDEDQGGGVSTLSNLLGDIPMDCVKSYSVKDTKDGKKIVIEIKNGPVVEHRSKVIIIRDDGKNPGKEKRGDHQTRKKIIIRTGDGNSGDEKSRM
jgi:hypothetical protein